MQLAYCFARMLQKLLGHLARIEVYLCVCNPGWRGFISKYRSDFLTALNIFAELLLLASASKTSLASLVKNNLNDITLHHHLYIL